MKVAEYFVDCNNNVTEREFTCGVEFEIEDIQDYSKVSPTLFMSEVDDSLRNHGREFKTHPSNFENTLKAFDHLWNRLFVGETPFSERTSIHVHVNVSQLSVVQAREFVLLYALLEPLFFKWVGEEREHNIFCVPLNYTYLPIHYKRDLGGLVDRWHKYTAFNILPVTTLGTFEFRHMYGTNDKEVFAFWLGALKELYDFINLNEELSVVKALAIMSPSDIAKAVVPSLAALTEDSKINDMLNDSQLDVKLSVGGLK